MLIWQEGGGIMPRQSNRKPSRKTKSNFSAIYKQVMQLYEKETPNIFSGGQWFVLDAPEGHQLCYKRYEFSVGQRLKGWAFIPVMIPADDFDIKEGLENLGLKVTKSKVDLPIGNLVVLYAPEANEIFLPEQGDEEQLSKAFQRHLREVSSGKDSIS
ncbi:hypothetical protein CL633_04115 [bacterium]|nr:hypothetical protein [bacterium]